MKYGIVSQEGMEDSPAIQELVQRSLALISDGWRFRPGILDYLREHYAVPDGQRYAFLLAYYLRFCPLIPGGHFIIVDDGEAALLGLLAPELGDIGSQSFTLERFRTDVEDFFCVQEAILADQRRKQAVKLACRRHGYRDFDDISHHYEILRDVWRDTPKHSWSDAFVDSASSQAKELRQTST